MRVGRYLTGMVAGLFLAGTIGCGTVKEFKFLGRTVLDRNTDPVNRINSAIDNAVRLPIRQNSQFYGTDNTIYLREKGELSKGKGFTQGGRLEDDYSRTGNILNIKF